jgi:hypothetical protein
MIRTSLLAALVLALSCSTATAQASGDVIKPPSTKSDGSVITPPDKQMDPGIQKKPDAGVNQSQLPNSAVPPRPTVPPTVPIVPGTLAPKPGSGNDASH